MVRTAVDQAAELFSWRVEQLASAGYPPDVAIELAENPHVDLRTALYLLESGCPVETALRILR